MHLDLPQDVLDRVGRVVRTTSLREIDYYRTSQRFTKKRLPGTNNALVARQVFQAVGGFDPAKIGAGSDSDFFCSTGVPALTCTTRRMRSCVIGSHSIGFRSSTSGGTPIKVRRHLPGWTINTKGVPHWSHGARRGVAHALLIVVPRLAWAWAQASWGSARREGAPVASRSICARRSRCWRRPGFRNHNTLPTWSSGAAGRSASRAAPMEGVA